MLALQRSGTVLAAVALAGYLIVVVPLAALAVAASPSTTSQHRYSRTSLLRSSRVYDDAWFAAQLSQINPPGVATTSLFYNPPTMSLLMLPLVGFAPQLARLIWTLLGVGLLLGGLVLLARVLALPARWGLWALPLALLYAPVTENSAGRTGVSAAVLSAMCGVLGAGARSDDGRITRWQWDADEH